MNLGVPKERRPYEYRVGLPPVGVGLFVRHNHTVYVEREAGSAAGFSDEDYARAGAKVVYSEEEVLGRADLVLKFARPLQEELLLMREDQVVAGFLHLAAARQDKFELLRKNKITAIAYEQVASERQLRQPSPLWARMLRSSMSTCGDSMRFSGTCSIAWLPCSRLSTTCRAPRPMPTS